ncbi:MAG: hypothetical protein U0325_25250 [Polyangiales bacterium]
MRLRPLRGAVPCGLTLCDGRCVDTTTRTDNRGRPGRRAPRAFVRNMGRCDVACAPPLVTQTAALDAGLDGGVGATARTSVIDFGNCGACGSACAAGFACVAGPAAPTATAPSTAAASAATPGHRPRHPRRLRQRLPRGAGLLQGSARPPAAAAPPSAAATA